MPPCVLTEEDGRDGLFPRPHVAPPPAAGQRVQLSFRPEPRRVAEMRRMAATALDCAGLLDPDVAGAVELLVSELVTNAVTHSPGGLVFFSLVCDAADKVRIEVADHSPGTPVVRHPGPDAENGRGMLLVSALASAWGTTPLPTGKQVWAELPGGGCDR
ncbi:ATP-binding protein [Streptomyces sp. NPDC046887]|uniref:ATP-binding protein n=1 Tax=Streptomyces sp. NPDC046887 TaxID=3155472 RepID=UPI0033D01A67